jgi:hypothetical protein
MAQLDASHHRGIRTETAVVPAQSSAPKKSTLVDVWAVEKGHNFRKASGALAQLGASI